MEDLNVLLQYIQALEESYKSISAYNSQFSITILSNGSSFVERVNSGREVIEFKNIDELKDALIHFEAEKI